MFTGIIEEVGKVISVRKGAHSCVLTVAANTVLDDVHLGDSIATNGVCLTVTEFTKQTFCADVMPETLQRSSLGGKKRKTCRPYGNRCYSKNSILWTLLWCW